MKKYENKDVKDLFVDPCFPKLLIFGENKEYVRKVIKETIENTSYFEDYVNINELEDTSRYCFYQDTTHKSDEAVASHQVIEKAIEMFGQDYRYEDKKHPIKELQDRKKDNISIGRCK